jgi:putative transposase
MCPQFGEVVDRDHNAARNLRDWPDHASCGPVRATAPSVPGPTEAVGTGHGADPGRSGACGAPVRPRPVGPGAERPESNRRQRRGETLQGDAA